MDDLVLKFNTNWNNKLNCDVFTTIRFSKKYLYLVDKRFKIYLKDKYQFDVILIDVKQILLKDLDNFTSFLDTGYDKQETIKIIKTMLKDVNENSFIYLLLLKKIKEV